MKERFLKVAVKADIKTQINILAAVQRKDISVFVGELVQSAWATAKADGKVTDSMLTEPEPVGSAASL